MEMNFQNGLFYPEDTLFLRLNLQFNNEKYQIFLTGAMFWLIPQRPLKQTLAAAKLDIGFTQVLLV